ncbi:hypothetical protein SDC9_190088 [bioreactor metagenome]|uniref:Uncharacterized protein n=1 Tax=bioreactor metagenome TaxID=1076179 RepID=A0A645HU10_9ZZZZ
MGGSIFHSYITFIGSLFSGYEGMLDSGNPIPDYFPYLFSHKIRVSQYYDSALFNGRSYKLESISRNPKTAGYYHISIHCPFHGSRIIFPFYYDTFLDHIFSPSSSHHCEYMRSKRRRKPLKDTEFLRKNTEGTKYSAQPSF